VAPVGQVVVGKELQVELVEFKRHRKLQVNLQVTTTTTTNSLTETAGKTTGNNNNKLGSNRSRDAVWVTVLGKLFTPIMPLFTKQ